MTFSKYIAVAILCSVAGAYSQSAEGPVQAGQAANCDRWTLVKDNDTCQTIVDRTPDITLPELLSWNHGAGPNCMTLMKGYDACTRAPPAPPGDVQPGQPDNCNRWDLVATGDSCQAIVDRRPDITLSQFLSWNPGAQQDCSTLWVNFYACTGAPVGAPKMVQPGQAVNCNLWYLVNSGDTCDTIANANPGISAADVIAWNAGVGPECTMLWPGYSACAGVSPPPTSSTAPSSTASPSSSASPTPTPTPTPYRRLARRGLALRGI